MSKGKGDYKNLKRRGRVWYLRATVHRRSYEESLETTSITEARIRRNTRLKELSNSPRGPNDSLTFAEAAEAALEWVEERVRKQRLALTTARDHRRHLHKDGSLVEALGELRLRELEPQHILRWASKYAKDFTAKTVANHLDSMSFTMRSARLQGHPDYRPVVKEARSQIMELEKTKGARAERDAKRRLAKHGALSPQQAGRFVQAAKELGLEEYVLALIYLELGVRRAEGDEIRRRRRH